MPRLIGPKGRTAKGARRRQSERGVALLMVLSMITLVGTVVADFQFSSRVDLQLAVNARDELQAEYNALSALRLRAIMHRQSRKLSGVMKGLASSFGLDGAMIPDIGRLMEMVPIECGLMSAITREAGVDLEEDDPGTGEFFPGECIATSESEHSKIPINALGKRGGPSEKVIAPMLMGMLGDRRLERHFQEDDRMGTHAEKPSDLVSALADWVDPDEVQRFNAVSDEDRHYDYLRDSYKPKNAPFDSLEELQLVHGIDDELFAILRPHVTIYNSNTYIELPTAPLERIVLALSGALHEGVVVDDLFMSPAFAELVSALYEMQQLTMGFGTFKTQVLSGLVNELGLGAFIDTKRLGEIFKDTSTPSWYTIEAQGRVGNANRRIRAVFQAHEGQFYYFRIE